MTKETAEKKSFWLIELLYSFFPVKKSEFSRFIPMALMMLFILANYTVLRNLKDTLVTTGVGSDADVIPYIKLFCVMPSAILFMLFYSKISSIFSKEKVFYISLLPFLVFFGVFSYIIYPNIDTMHVSPETLANWKLAYPRFQWILVMIGNWSYTLFYVLSELWGSAVLTLLFWGFANEITKTDTAKRFYPLFGFIGNIGLIISGKLTSFLTTRSVHSATPETVMQDTLGLLMPILIVSGLIIMALYWRINKMSKSGTFELPERKQSKKPKLGIGESLKYVFASKHLMFMALMILAYGVTINFVDVLWKGQVKELMQIQYPEYGKEQLKLAYLGYMASFSKMTGYIALPLMLFGGMILRRLSWFQAALVTPSILAIAGGGFIITVFYGYWTGAASEPILLFGQTTTLVGIAASLGYWMNALTKATKYSLFDATKEMAYFPLDSELRSKGKAAVDLVGGRLGKSGGSLTITALKTLLPGVALPGLSPFLLVIFFTILGGWYIGVVGLNKSYLSLTDENKAEPAIA